MTERVPERQPVTVPRLLAGACLLAAILIMVFGQYLDRKAKRAAARFQASIVTIDAAVPPDPAHDGRLVFVSGSVRTSGPVTDTDTGFATAGLSLIREGAMFQWMRDSGGSGFRRQWLSFPAFDVLLAAGNGADAPRNPPMPLDYRRFVAPGLMIGAMPLDAGLAASLPAAGRRDVTAEALPRVAATLGRDALRLDGDQIVSAATGADPEVGDIRISYVARNLPAGPVSLLARQTDGRLVPLPPEESERFTTTVLGGVKDLPVFLAAVRDTSKTGWLWIMRFWGLAPILYGAAVLIFWGQNLPAWLWKNDITGIILTIPVFAIALPAWFFAMLVALAIAATWWTLALGMLAWLAAAALLARLWLGRGPAPAI